MANIQDWKFYKLFSVNDGVRSFRKIVYVLRHTNFNVWFGNVECLGEHKERYDEGYEEEIMFYRLHYVGDEERLSKNQTLLKIELDEGYGEDYENLTITVDSHAFITRIYNNEQLHYKDILCYQCNEVSCGKYGYDYDPENKPMCNRHKRRENFCGCGSNIIECENCMGEYAQDHYEFYVRRVRENLLEFQLREQELRGQRREQPPNEVQPPNA
jgi:hypothetical protein